MATAKKSAEAGLGEGIGKAKGVPMDVIVERFDGRLSDGTLAVTVTLKFPEPQAGLREALERASLWSLLQAIGEVVAEKAGEELRRAERETIH